MLYLNGMLPFCHFIVGRHMPNIGSKMMPTGTLHLNALTLNNDFNLTGANSFISMPLLANIQW